MKEIEQLFIDRLAAEGWTAYFDDELGRVVTNAYAHELEFLRRISGMFCEVVCDGWDGHCCKIGPVLLQEPGLPGKPEPAPSAGAKVWVVVNESFEYGEHRCGVHRSRVGAYVAARGEIELYGEHHGVNSEDVESALKDLGDEFQNEVEHAEQFGGGDPSALFYVTATLCEVGP